MQARSGAPIADKEFYILARLRHSAILGHAARGRRLARFERGKRGTIPDDWLASHDDTHEVQEVYKARLTFTVLDSRGLQFSGNPFVDFNVDTGQVRAEMQRLGVTRWSVRFADLMSLDEFFDRSWRGSDRDSGTGRFGRWLNPL